MSTYIHLRRLVYDLTSDNKIQDRVLRNVSMSE